MTQEIEVRIYPNKNAYWQCVKCNNIFRYRKLAEKCFRGHQ